MCISVCVCEQENNLIEKQMNLLSLIFVDLPKIFIFFTDLFVLLSTKTLMHRLSP